MIQHLLLGSIFNLVIELGGGHTLPCLRCQSSRSFLDSALRSKALHMTDMDSAAASSVMDCLDGSALTDKLVWTFLYSTNVNESLLLSFYLSVLKGILNILCQSQSTPCAPTLSINASRSPTVVFSSKQVMECSTDTDMSMHF